MPALRSLAALISAWLLVCGSSSRAETPSPSDLKRAGEGIVFFNVAYNNEHCRGGVLHLATEPSPGKYEKHSEVVLGSLGGSPNRHLEPRQIKLAAGTYHFALFNCFLGNRDAMIGEADGLFSAKPRQSLARFTVMSGEMLNVGLVNVVGATALSAEAKVVVHDLDGGAKERLKAGMPIAAKALVTRLATSTGQTIKLRWMVRVR